MNKQLLILLIGTAALIAGCASSEKTGDEPNPQPLKNHSFASQWSTRLGGAGGDPITALHVTDQFVFAYRRGGTSTVIDRSSGRLLHIDEPKDGSVRMHPPVVLKDRIVYPTTTFLEVFDLKGRYIRHPMRPTDELDKPFSQNLPSAIRSDAVGSGKVVVLGADSAAGGRFVEVDMMRPYVPELWTLLEPGASVPAGPALVGDVVYIAAANGRVAAVTLENRTPLWGLESGEFVTYGPIVANLAADDTGLYVASMDTKLYCLVRSNGRVKWQYFAGAPLRDAPVVTKDLIYQTVRGVGLVAIDKVQPITSQSPTYNRQPRWVAADAAQFLTQDDTYAYARSNDNHIVALDKKTGQPAFNSERNDLTAFAVNTKGDGMIYVASDAGEVIAVKPVLQPGQVGQVVMVPAAPQTVAIAR